MSWYLSDGISSADCIAAFQPIGAASASAALVNLNNPGTHNATASVAPGWTTSGWSFNGSNQYVDTSVVPAANMTVIVRCDAFSGTATLVGHYLAAAARLEISGDGGSSYYCNAGSVQVGPLTVTGVYAVSGTQGYRNGAADGAATGTAFSGTATQTLLIGARRREDTSGIDSYGNQTIQAVAIYSRILTATEVQAVSTAMAALTAGGTPPTILSATVPAAHGANVTLLFSESVTGVAASDYVLTSNGLPVGISSVSRYRNDMDAQLGAALDQSWANGPALLHRIRHDGCQQQRACWFRQFGGDQRQHDHVACHQARRHAGGCVHLVLARQFHQPPVGRGRPLLDQPLRAYRAEHRPMA